MARFMRGMLSPQEYHYGANPKASRRGSRYKRREDRKTLNEEIATASHAYWKFEAGQQLSAREAGLLAHDGDSAWKAKVLRRYPKAEKPRDEFINRRDKYSCG